MGKKFSKSRRVTRYYNKFWRLGILDNDLRRNYLIEKDRHFMVDLRLEQENKLARKQKLDKVFFGILKKEGLIKVMYIFSIFLVNTVYKKIRLSNDC